MRLKSIIGVLAFLVVSGFSHGQESLSLKQAIEKAMQNNYQLQISDLNLEIAKNNNQWGTVGAYPGISAGATNVNRYDDNSSGEYSTHSVAPYVSLSYVIFNGFSARINKAKLQELEYLSEGNARLIVENTLQAVVLAYYRVLLAQEQVSVFKELADLSRDRYDYELTKKELGNAVTFDVLQAKTAYLSDSSNYLLQQNNYRNAQRNLNQLMADEIGKSYALSGELSPSYKKYLLDDLEEKMLSNNSNLKNQFINQEIMKKSVQGERSALYPTFSLSSGADYANSRYKFKNMSATTSDTYDYYANFTLSFNVFNGGSTRRAIQNAQIDEKIGALNMQELKNTLRRSLRNSFELYEVRKQLFDVAVENEQASKLNMSIAEDRFKSGAINSFNYRDIQLVYLNTALGKLEAAYNLIDAQTELMRITGNIVSEY